MVVNLFDELDLIVEGKPTKVIAEEDTYKIRVINLKQNQSIPTCSMQWSVLFYVVKGEVHIEVDGKDILLIEDHLLITSPASIAMFSASGARILGIQIKS